MYRRLYNFSPNRCNIAGQSTNIPKLTDPWHYYTYKYDQLNRIRQSYTYKVSTAAVATRVLDYSERFTYDGNGNIDSAARYMGANTKMDSTLYHYNTSNGRLINNRLNYITDNITTHNYPYGLDNQAVNNYTYDATGNMLTDVVDTVSNITWTVYGKIQGLTNSKGSIAYSYDPAGQRATKTVSGITTYYIRDAQGNPLAIYDNTHSVVNWREQYLYGSSRLASWNVNSVITTNMQTGVNKFDSTGYKEYELTNHLGNVMVTITDKRLQHTTNGTTVDYFTPDISTAQEYYAFGGLMAGRNYTFSKSYRYGFNGQERSDEISGAGNHNTAEFWEYDTRVGRRWNIEPLIVKYPWFSGYASFGDDPILFSDINGKDGIASTTGTGTKKDPVIVVITANYYFNTATDAQSSAMSTVKSDLAVPKNIENDGKYYKVIINVSFIKSDDPVKSAKKDVGVKGASFGNVLNIISSGKGGESGNASDNTIQVFDNKVAGFSNQFTDENKDQSYKNIFRNVLLEEVLHNLGGLHQDGDAVPPITEYSTGSSSLTTKEAPATTNSYTKNNARAILNRVDKPLGTDAKPNPVDKHGNAQNPPLRDDAGTVGQVKTDNKPPQ